MEVYDPLIIHFPSRIPEFSNCLRFRYRTCQSDFASNGSGIGLMAKYCKLYGDELVTVVRIITPTIPSSLSHIQLLSPAIGWDTNNDFHHLLVDGWLERSLWRGCGLHCGGLNGMCEVLLAFLPGAFQCLTMTQVVSWRQRTKGKVMHLVKNGRV